MAPPAELTVNKTAKNRLRARKPYDYDNELDSWPDDDDDPQIAQIIDWMQALTERGKTYRVWGKYSDGQHVGGDYSSARIVNLVKDAMTHSGNAVGVHFSINPIDPSVRSMSDHQLERGVGAPKDSAVVHRRILPIDIDPRRPTDISATEEEKARARKKAFAIGRYLNELGWPKPAIVDSGNGFYLLYRVDLSAADGGLVRSVLKAIQDRFADDRVEIDTTVANPGRVLKIPGTMACKGKSTKERPHRPSGVVRMPKAGLQVVPEALLESLAAKTSTGISVSAAAPSASVPPALVAAAHNYIAKMPPAISGQKGHGKTLTVATRVVDGFDIAWDSPTAMQLMQEYNLRCKPAWSNEELLYKLEEADRLARENNSPRGDLRRDTAETASYWEPLEGPEFLIEIPDYAPIAADQVLIPVEHFCELSPWYGLGAYLVWRAQRSGALVPDVVARQVYYGANPPTAWRRTLRAKTKQYRWREECRSDCSLFGSNIRHQHMVRLKAGRNGALEAFTTHSLGCEPNESGELVLPKKAHRKYCFQSDHSTFKEMRAKCQKEGSIYQCYYPVLVFGCSPRVGLTAQQVRLLTGMTRELTRVAKEASFEDDSGKPKFGRRVSDRIDRADVIDARRVHHNARQGAKMVCGLLEESAQYVVFGGNLAKHRGCGYRIVHAEHQCWLDIAGYTSEEYGNDSWKCIKTFLDDLAALADMFGLVVAARHHQRREWKSLDEVRAFLKTSYGKEWLQECTLRIFAPADYLIRWRHMFAQKLGFRWIPGGVECPFSDGTQSSDKGTMITNGAQLRASLDQHGWTTAKLAKKIKCRRETVSRHLSGRHNSPAFWESANRILQKTTNKTVLTKSAKKAAV